MSGLIGGSLAVSSEVFLSGGRNITQLSLHSDPLFAAALVLLAGAGAFKTPDWDRDF
jgi:hypothetical protein